MCGGETGRDRVCLPRDGVRAGGGAGKRARLPGKTARRGGLLNPHPLPFLFLLVTHPPIPLEAPPSFPGYPCLGLTGGSQSLPLLLSSPVPPALLPSRPELSRVHAPGARPAFPPALCLVGTLNRCAVSV